MSCKSLSAASTHTKGGAMLCVAVVVGMVCCCEGRLVGTLILTVVLVATWHNCQSQQVKTKYECKDFHGFKGKEKYCLMKRILKRWQLHSSRFFVGRLSGGKKRDVCNERWH